MNADREDMLRALVAHAVAVKEVRLIRDKFTGQPRGFGFMEFHSVSDAAHALQMLQVKHLCSINAADSRLNSCSKVKHCCLLQAEGSVGGKDASCQSISEVHHDAYKAWSGCAECQGGRAAKPA